MLRPEGDADCLPRLSKFCISVAVRFRRRRQGEEAADEAALRADIKVVQLDHGGTGRAASCFQGSKVFRLQLGADIERFLLRYVGPYTSKITTARNRFCTKDRRLGYDVDADVQRMVLVGTIMAWIFVRRTSLRARSLLLG